MYQKREVQFFFYPKEINLVRGSCCFTNVVSITHINHVIFHTTLDLSVLSGSEVLNLNERLGLNESEVLTPDEHNSLYNLLI